eukprot:GCRY01003711.1.p1 GENE.GCRY01003711.1~~GCRY01003711.1.p1  ORF type:complete len:525 (-),score=87.51 GCRY01003711.1:197-1771(-)
MNSEDPGENPDSMVNEDLTETLSAIENLNIAPVLVHPEKQDYNHYNEFQAVINGCEFDDKLSPLTDDIPKILLPIAGKTLLHLQFEMLEAAAIMECFLIVSKKRLKIVKPVVSAYKGNLSVMMVPVEDELGSAQCLAKLREKLQGSIIYLSGDMVSIPFIHRMVELHRVQEDALTLFLFDDSVTRKKKDQADKLVVALAPVEQSNGADDTKRILKVSPFEDVEDSFRLKNKLLQRFPNVVVDTSLVSSHCYVLKSWLVDLIVEKELVSLEKDLVPFICRCQFNDRLIATSEILSLLKKDFSNDFNDMEQMPILKVASQEGISSPIPLSTAGENSSESLEINRALRQLKSHHIAYGMSSARRPQTSFSVHAYVASREDFSARVSSFSSYLYAAQKVPAGHSPTCSVAFPKDLKERYLGKDVTIGEKSVVSSGSVVGDKTVFGNKTNVQRSTVGKNCEFGNMVKVTNSVIMDDVKIQDGVRISNSIVGSGCTVCEGATITDAQLGARVVVEAGSDVRNEKRSSLGA